MLLTLDVGNTNITIGVYNGDELLFVSRMATDVCRMEDQYAIELNDIITLYGIDKQSVNGAIISSVVPRLTTYISRAIERVFALKALVVKPKLVPDLKVKGGTLNAVGSDLIVGCVAAKTMYSCPNIVIDMGTATTLFVMDEEEYMLGGCILPGLGISLDALTSGAAQLSAVSLEAPGTVIGKDTASCIQSGLIYGTAAMLDGLCERIQEELGQSCTIIATGGLAKIIVDHCKSEIILSDTLLLDGLKIIYEKNSSGQA